MCPTKQTINNLHKQTKHLSVIFLGNLVLRIWPSDPAHKTSVKITFYIYKYVFLLKENFIEDYKQQIDKLDDKLLFFQKEFDEI